MADGGLERPAYRRVRTLRRVGFGRRPPAASQTLSETGIGGQTRGCAGERRGIVGWHEQRVALVAQVLGRPIDHRCAERLTVDHVLERIEDVMSAPRGP